MLGSPAKNVCARSGLCSIPCWISSNTIWRQLPVRTAQGHPHPLECRGHLNSRQSPRRAPGCTEYSSRHSSRRWVKCSGPAQPNTVLAQAQGKLGHTRFLPIVAQHCWRAFDALVIQGISQADSPHSMQALAWQCLTTYLDPPITPSRPSVLLISCTDLSTL